jgi:hypothetical protein
MYGELTSEIYRKFTELSNVTNKFLYRSYEIFNSDQIEELDEALEILFSQVKTLYPENTQPYKLSKYMLEYIKNL